MGVFRSRGPLALILYVAAREGRLAWRDETSFAVLEAPPARRAPYRLGYVPWVLRLLDRRWEPVLFALPPALALLAAAATLPFPTLWLAGLLLAALVIGYVAVPMTTQLLYGGWRLLRRLAGRGTDPVVDELSSQHWSLRFCHERDPGKVDDLLILAVQRLERLVVTPIAVSASHAGVRAGSLVPTEPLVCLLDGVTTDPMRAAIRRAKDRSPAPSVAIIAATAESGDRPPRTEDSGRFFFLYLAGMAVVVLAEARLVADWERAACDGADCSGRPASYLPALRWLLQRLLLSDPDGLSPATTEVWVVGWLVSVMAVMAVPVAGVALRQHWRVREREQLRLANLVRSATVLVLVAAAVEWDAVIAALRQAGAARMELRFAGPESVLKFGSIGGVSVQLARCGQASVAPGGSTLTTQSLIEHLAPDYVILTGICYGLRDGEHQLGDVLVGNQLRTIDHRKVTDVAVDPGRIRVDEIPRGDRVRPSGLLLSRCQAATATWSRPPDVYFGPVLSGSMLLDSAELRSAIADREPEAIGGEMEGAGVYAAAARHKTDWIVVKAISDWGFHKEHAGHPEQRRIAAENAARFVVHVLRTGGLGNPAS